MNKHFLEEWPSPNILKMTDLLCVECDRTATQECEHCHAPLCDNCYYPLELCIPCLEEEEDFSPYFDGKGTVDHEENLQSKQ